MSGIAGIIRFDGIPIEPGLVEAMTSGMAHRGPDGIGHWIKGSVAIGNCMLRTTPESLEETLPLANEDQSLVLVMDGRVDNWEELRKELLGRGLLLRNRSDAELVLRAYETWGRDCLSHIEGDFALAVWDRGLQKLFCARDRMGIKPFNYYWDGRTFVFASELHAILQLPTVLEEPNEGMLAEFLAFEWYSRDETPWKGIYRLVAAHCMEISGRGLKTEQYWEPSLEEVLPYKTENEYVEHYRELFSDAVRRLSRSHRPIAIQVSGGLDSSAVFSMAEHLRIQGRLKAPDLQGYTFAFSDKSEADEVEYARAVGKHFGRQIHEIEPSKPSLDWYDERAKIYREFPGYPNGIMCVGLMKAVSDRGSRVILTGQGGDQWLQAERIYYAEELSRLRWISAFNCLKEDVGAYGAKQAAYWFLRQGVFLLLPTRAQKAARALFGKGGAIAEGPYWLSPRMQEMVEQRRKLPKPGTGKIFRLLSQKRLLEILYDPFITLVMERFDRESARAGTEQRNPFYEQRFVQFAFSTPERMRLRGDKVKYIHVRAMQGLMSPTVLERKSRAYFSLVFHHHLLHMQGLFEMDIPLKHGDWFSPEGINRLFREYKNDPGEGKRMWPLWSAFGCDTLIKRNLTKAKPC